MALHLPLVGLLGGLLAPARWTEYLLDAITAVQALQAGSRLHYEFYEEQDGNETAGGVRVIDLKGVDKYAESEHEILFQLVKQFNVPEKLRYAPQRTARSMKCRKLLPSNWLYCDPPLF